MRYRYDFHMHSCLSPCAEPDMTPYNIANMAKILELDIIALTDHNTTGNCASTIKAGEECGLTVIPGMELCTSEEIHVVCLFPGLEQSDAFNEYVKTTLSPVKNKPEFFGDQWYMDAEDNVLGEEEIFLLNASGISIEQVRQLCDQYEGFCYPAHVDRDSFSIISSLGSFPRELGFTCAEISARADPTTLMRLYPPLTEVRLMYSSDAHRLEDMAPARDTIGAAPSAADVLAWFRGLTVQKR